MINYFPTQVGLGQTQQWEPDGLEHIQTAKDVHAIAWNRICYYILTAL